MSIGCEFRRTALCFALPSGYLHDAKREGAVWVDRLMQINCYSYALGIPDHGKGIPGQLRLDHYKSPPDSEFTVDAMRDRILHDGLSLADDTEEIPKGSVLIAAFVAPGHDVHFYRREIDGAWTHKPGNEFVTRLDNSGNPIEDPMTADRGIYTEFVGFFVMKPFSVTFYPHLSRFNDDGSVACEEAASIPPLLAYTA